MALIVKRGNFDSALNSARSVLRGEAPGSIKFLVAALLALAVWTGVMMVKGWTEQDAMTLALQQGRFKTLLSLGSEYKSLAPSQNSNANRNVDVASVFAQVSERMQLGSRVNRISPDGRNQAVEINRLYADELTELQKQLASQGVRIIAVELRALPAGAERLMTVSAIIGPVN